ncbi:hypothetical protein [Streptomyces antimycoticus]|nr:hypothetical protein [Streptomyces antimycoticus]
MIVSSPPAGNRFTLTASPNWTLALFVAYESWSDTTSGAGFGGVARRTLSDVRAANTLC